MKGKGPKLPERRKGATTNAQAGSPGFVQQSPGQPGLQELQQQLNSHPVFRQFVDQPDKLLAVLQHDQVLADAAASNPEVAALLDPSTLRQALSVLQGSPVEPQQQQQQQEASVPGVQRKALMQLQNYAMQLQQARRSGMGPAQLQQQQQHVMQAMQVQPAAGNMDSVSLQGPGSGGMADSSMWDALQQRLNKMQQRSSLLGTMPGVQGSPHSAHLQQQPGSQGPPSPWLSEQVQQQHMQQQQQQQVFQVQRSEQQQQQQQAVPMLQHGRFKDAAYRPFLQHGSSSSMGSPGSSPQVRLARLTMPDGLFSSGSGKIMSPLARVTSPGGLTGAAGSGPCLSPGSISALQRRSSSSLSHRLLRHSSATPLDLTDLKHSGSQAINVEQLECGDVIVDITPPTRVTQELAWSTDPTAAYVLEAASSGSFGHLTASDSNTQLPVSTLAATASTPSAGNIASAAAAAGAGASVVLGSAGPAPAGAFGGFVGQGLHPSGTTDQQQQAHQLYALPLLGAASTTAQGNAQAVSAEDASRGDSGNQAVPEVAAAAVTEQPAAAVTATGGRRSSTSSRQKASSQKLVLRVATPPQQKQAQGAAQAMQQLHQQQQQQQEDHYSYVDLSDATGRSTVSDSKQAQQQQYYQHIHQQQQQQQQGSQQDSAAATALAGARAAAAAGGSLNARTYYESVEPSNWRPTDVGSAPGDYLELYRRAYCSYADALFPPLWMGLVATLATLQLLPLWQLCLLGVATFWGGMWLMAIKWAGVAPAHLGLSRVTPMLTVCLELMCTGAFVSQVLPVMWLGHSLLCMALLVSSFAMMGLHLTAYLQDPGYTPLPDAEQGPYARHLDAAASSKRSSPSTAGTSSSAGQTAADAAAGEQTPLLSNAGQQQQPQQQAGQPGGGAAGPAAWNGQPMDHCWTCRVKRNLRSKHCPLCKRCVERFDHHCPVLGNCVGAGNHKTFVAFIALMFLSQVLFCQVVSSMLTQTYLLQLAAPQHSVGNLHTGSRLRHGSSRSATGDSMQTGAQLANGAGADAAAKAAAAAGAAVASKADTGSTAEGAQSGASNTLQQVTHSSTQGNRPDAAGPVAGAYPEKHKSQGLWLTLQALWAAGSTHMGLLLLLFAQVPTMFMSGFLLFRALALAAANLTVNEWMNRQRYVHLHYTGAGFSNRFDRGVGANCYDFWCGPKLVDYWRLWDAAEQEMQRKGMTVLLLWSPTVLVRFWDVRWSKYQQRLVSSRERRKELQMQRRMQALGLPSHS